MVPTLLKKNIKIVHLSDFSVLKCRPNIDNECIKVNLRVSLGSIYDKIGKTSILFPPCSLMIGWGFSVVISSQS